MIGKNYYIKAIINIVVYKIKIMVLRKGAKKGLYSNKTIRNPTSTKTTLGNTDDIRPLLDMCKGLIGMILVIKPMCQKQKLRHFLNRSLN